MELEIGPTLGGRSPLSAGGARYVVAVAGPPGSGKSSLVRGLLESMDDAAAIHMDSYERMTRQPIEAIARWLERGADLDELPVPLLAEHLESLKRGEAVVEPRAGTEIAPRKYVLFETQFGRAHRGTGRHIDLLVWLDTPLDVALARNVKSFIGPLLAGASTAECMERLAWIDGYLDGYLSVVGRLLVMQRDRVRAGADVIVDGRSDPAAGIRQVREAILDRLR